MAEVFLLWIGVEYSHELQCYWCRWASPLTFILKFVQDIAIEKSHTLEPCSSVLMTSSIPQPVFKILLLSSAIPLSLLHKICSMEVVVMQ